MIGRSIYLRDRAAFTGGSPQAVYEELWDRGRKQRLRLRAAFAAGALLLGFQMVSPVFGVVLAAAVALADIGHHAWRRASARVWRRGLRGEEQMGRLLRFTLERRGFRVLHSRRVPGHGTVDQLVVGPTGLWVVHNDAWHPDTEFAVHGGRLFIDGKTRPQLTAGPADAARIVGKLLSERLGTDVTVTPLIAVHTGRLPWRGLDGDGVSLLRPLLVLARLFRERASHYSEKEIDEIVRAAVHTLHISGRGMSGTAGASGAPAGSGQQGAQDSPDASAA